MQDDIFINLNTEEVFPNYMFKEIPNTDTIIKALPFSE
jgi:hypothetical protein